MRVVIELSERSAEITRDIYELGNEVDLLAAALVNAIKSIGFYPKFAIEAMQKEANKD